MGFQKVETFPFQNIPRNLLANKTQVTPLRAPGLIAFARRCTQSGTHQWGSSKKIWRSRSKQNRRRRISMSCWHCNDCIIMCWKCIAFTGRCTQRCTHQWESMKKIQVKHDLGSGLYGGQGQNKIGGAHLCHVGIAMQACHFFQKIWLLLNTARKVVPISEDRQRKSKLDTTSGAGYMEVKVKIK